ncbi:unnamed protein product, partial [Ectocarpus sp. 12 AP-2014]
MGTTGTQEPDSQATPAALLSAASDLLQRPRWRWQWYQTDWWGRYDESNIGAVLKETPRSLGPPERRDLQEPRRFSGWARRRDSAQ